MSSVNEAKTLILEHSGHLNQVRVPLMRGFGRILAADVYARYDVPFFRQSSMDGFAFHFQDKDLALSIEGEMVAGTTKPFTIEYGQACRIFTGAPLPQGADTVVMQEKTRIVAGKVFIEDKNITKGDNLRQIGAEIKAGALAMREGELLNPAALGFLSGIGIHEVEIIPSPSVSIIATGDELIVSGEKPGFGKVFESNSTSLWAALKQEGVEVINFRKSEDNLVALSEILSDEIQKSDLVLLTGGVSVGDYDFVVEAAQRCGVAQIFHGIRQKPGKPLFFGKKAQKIVFGLPGNPASVLNCFYNYVRPCIRHLRNESNVFPEYSATLKGDFIKPAAIAQFLKGVYENGIAAPLGAQESFKLSSFAVANCLIYLPEGKSHYLSGEQVKIIPVNSFSQQSYV